MRLWRELNGFRQRHDGSKPIDGLGKLLNEGMRGARDEGQFHIVPILADGVVHDGPSLQQRPFLCFGGENNAVRGFPNGYFADVADEDIAFASSSCREGYAPDILVAGGSDQAEILSDFSSQIVLGDTNAGGGIEIGAADFASISDQGYLVSPHRPV